MITWREIPDWFMKKVYMKAEGIQATSSHPHTFYFTLQVDQVQAQNKIHFIRWDDFQKFMDSRRQFPFERFVIFNQLKVTW